MPVAIIVPIDAVDEIRVFKDTVVVESFGVDAQSFLLLEYLGQGLSQIGHLKPLFCWRNALQYNDNLPVRRKW